MELGEFIQYLIDEGYIDAIRTNTVAQFGLPNQPFLGASILPEVEQPLNMYKEQRVRFTSVIASPGGRYSPVQLRQGGQMFASFLVELGESDIGRNFDGRDYDALMDLLRQTNGSNATDMPLERAASLFGSWTDTAINFALMQLNEKQRWEAIVGASTTSKGDNGLVQTINFYDPPNHRSAAGSVWSNDANDPWPEIQAKVQVLRDKGYVPTMIVTSSKVMQILKGNLNIARRTGAAFVTKTADNNVNVQMQDMVTNERINQLASYEQMPPFTIYDTRYRDIDGGYKRYLPEDALVIVCQNGPDQEVVNNLDPEDTRFIPSPLGYFGIGTPQGEPSPGRVIRLKARTDDKPYHVAAKGWQTGGPVLTDPEAVAAITGIS